MGFSEKSTKPLDVILGSKYFYGLGQSDLNWPGVKVWSTTLFNINIVSGVYLVLYMCCMNECFNREEY